MDLPVAMYLWETRLIYKHKGAVLCAVPFRVDESVVCPSWSLTRTPFFVGKSQPRMVKHSHGHITLPFLRPVRRRGMFTITSNVGVSRGSLRVIPDGVHRHNVEDLFRTIAATIPPDDGHDSAAASIPDTVRAEEAIGRPDEGRGWKCSC